MTVFSLGLTMPNRQYLIIIIHSFILYLTLRICSASPEESLVSEFKNATIGVNNLSGNSDGSLQTFQENEVNLTPVHSLPGSNHSINDSRLKNASTELQTDVHKANTTSTNANLLPIQDLSDSDINAELLIKLPNDTHSHTELLPKQGSASEQNHTTDGSFNEHVSKDVSSQDRSQENLQLAIENATKYSSIWQENATQPLFKVHIRKCCKTFEFYNIVKGDCDESNVTQYFYNRISVLLQNISNENIEFIEGPLKNCSLNNGTPLINDQLSNLTHMLSKTGEVFEFNSREFFSHSEYCLETLGEDPSTAELTLAFCPKESNDDYGYYYDYYSDEVEAEGEASMDVGDDSEFVVRKCCEESDYFNEADNGCAPLEFKNQFSEVVQGLSFENGIKNVKVESSRLTECSNDFEELTTKKINPQAYRLRYNGVIIDTSTGVPYDSFRYCLEQFGNSSLSIDLTIVFCDVMRNMIPKCCPTDHFFDSTLLECLAFNSKDSNQSDRLLDVFQINKSKYIIKPLSHLLSCKSAFPSKEYAENIHFNGGDMCARGNCYTNKDYCIELDRAENMELTSIAFFCHTEFYIKCCARGEILDNNGCTEQFGKSSFLMKQLSRTRKAVTAFDYRKCADENAVLLDESLTSYLEWWVGKDGSNLMIESKLETRQVDHYCIDDFANFKGDIQPSAFVCADEVRNLIPSDLGLRDFQEKGSLGKCCQRDSVDGVVYYFSLEDSQCKQLFNRPLKNNSFILEAGLTKEHFHDFPECQSTATGYHSYPLLKTDVDHAVLTSEGTLRVLSIEGKCISKEQLIESQDFCYEYTLEDGTLQPLAFVCSIDVVLEVHLEKFGIISALLGISCVCLLAAFIYLLTMKVRRGVVSTRKINTLAGKILISFVGSHLIGFISLSLTQHENALNKSGTVWCYILAGSIQFFNLATFCWNTSICLESLLLTIHIRISDWARYLLHSLWAWGFPAIMTTLMIVIDKYRDSLPCGTIAPKIGVNHCFYSDDNAHLLYFYVPIFITLTANILFLFGAKALRRSRLKKLEMGPRGRKAKCVQGKNEAGANVAPASSGMRIHQSHNTKADSLRLVLWTGGTWFLELAGFVTTKYLLPHNSERWYDYLWYIPTSINALRGVGVFAIVVLTPDVRGKISLHTKRAHETLSSRFQSWGVRSKRNESDNSLADREAYANRERNRNMSISTMISNLSSLYDASTKSRRNSVSGFAKSENNDEVPKRKTLRFSMFRSVSQIQRQSSVSSTADDFELENDMQRRKSSLTLSSAGSLPRLQEEDSVFEADPEVAGIVVEAKKDTSSEV